MLFVLPNYLTGTSNLQCNQNQFVAICGTQRKPGLIWNIGLTYQKSGFNHTDTIDTIYCVKDMIHVLIE